MIVLRRMSRGVLLLNAINLTQYFLWAKRPLSSGLTSRCHSSQQRWQLGRGRFVLRRKEEVMTIKIKFSNRKQSIGFFSAFGMKHTVAALNAAEERDRQNRLVKESEITYKNIYDLYQAELLKRNRDWQALGRLGELKGKAFDRMMRRIDATNGM
jgi:hypothetical protein